MCPLPGKPVPANVPSALLGWVGGRFLHQFATGFAQWRPVQMQWPQSAPDRDGPRKEGTELVGTSNYQKLRSDTGIPSSWLPPRRCVRILFDICIHFSIHDRCVFVWCLNSGSHSEVTHRWVTSRWDPELRHQTNTQSFSGNLDRSMTGQSVTYSRLPKKLGSFLQ